MRGSGIGMTIRSMTAEHMDCACPGCHPSRYSRSPGNEIFLAGVKAHLFTIKNNDVRAFDHDEVFVKRMNVFNCCGIGSAFPECHLTAFSAVKYISFDARRVLRAACDQIRWTFHERGKTSHDS